MSKTTESSRYDRLGVILPAPNPLLSSDLQYFAIPSSPNVFNTLENYLRCSEDIIAAAEKYYQFRLTLLITRLATSWKSI